jgi:MtfA peptidase
VVDLHAYYRDAVVRQRRQIVVVAGILLVVFIAATAAKEAYLALLAGSFSILMAALLVYRRKTERFHVRLRLLAAEFPPQWHLVLVDHSTYYNRLSDDDKRLFGVRVLFFLEEIRIEGVETEVDDEIKLMVAAGAIIPTFAFPTFDYPNLRNVLIYPEAFNERFETDSTDRDDAHNSGMVGTGYMNYSLLLSRRDLLAGFSGTRTSRNVAIHEFAHLLDKADGSTDGVPAILMNQGSIEAWLGLMDEEMESIERGRSDIDEYALTDHAEFFAVACEYFFNSPEKCTYHHPELYEYLCAIFQQDPAGYGYRAS